MLEIGGNLWASRLGTRRRERHENIYNKKPCCVLGSRETQMGSRGEGQKGCLKTRNRREIEVDDDNENRNRLKQKLKMNMDRLI